MKIPAHMNIVFLSGDINPLCADLGDRRFMIVEPRAAEEIRPAPNQEMQFSAWTKAVLSRIETSPLHQWQGVYHDSRVTP